MKSVILETVVRLEIYGGNFRYTIYYQSHYFNNVYYNYCDFNVSKTNQFIYIKEVQIPAFFKGSRTLTIRLKWQKATEAYFLRVGKDIIRAAL